MVVGRLPQDQVPDRLEYLRCFYAPAPFLDVRQLHMHAMSHVIMCGCNSTQVCSHDMRLTGSVWVAGSVWVNLQSSRRVSHLHLHQRILPECQRPSTNALGAGHKLGMVGRLPNELGKFPEPLLQFSTACCSWALHTHRAMSSYANPGGEQACSLAHPWDMTFGMTAQHRHEQRCATRSVAQNDEGQCLASGQYASGECR